MTESLFDSWQKQKICRDLARDPRILWVSEVRSMLVSHHSAPFSASVRNVWRYTSIPPCFHDEKRNTNFNLFAIQRFVVWFKDIVTLDSVKLHVVTTTLKHMCVCHEL